ncbi:MAG: KH domain-containing protein [Candidatus Saliniplasma sp.]
MIDIKIPKERIGVLIGENGEVKSEIEERSGAELEIDSKTGLVEIDVEDIDDPLMPMQVEDVIKAIGRGFNPNKALKIFDKDVYFELLDMRDYVGKNANAVHRISGRVIGKNGRSREIIEELTKTYVSVYGNTIGIIGGSVEISIAKRAIEMLLDGSEHSSVFSFLEKSRADIKKARSGFYIEE